MTITLKDGYNGHTTLFSAEPVEVSNSLGVVNVKLRVAEPGREYLIAWKSKEAYLFALGAKFEHLSLAEAAWLISIQEAC